MSDRGTCWSVTINNPTKSDEEGIAQARQKGGWKVYGQLEKGCEGTEHYQLMVTTPQVRFAAVKKAFPRAHIELARDKKALAKYVQKEDTRIGEIISNDKYPTVNAMWDLFADWLNYEGYTTRFYDVDGDGKLNMFRKFGCYAIDNDYYVDVHLVNPQILSLVKNYGEQIVNRSLRRQTDRQTAETILTEQDITECPSEEESMERKVECASVSVTSEDSDEL